MEKLRNGDNQPGAQRFDYAAAVAVAAAVEVMCSEKCIIIENPRRLSPRHVFLMRIRALFGSLFLGK